MIKTKFSQDPILKRCLRHARSGLEIGSCLILFTLCGCQDQRLYTDNRVMMGTFIEVVSPDKEAAGIVFDEIKRIEKLLSKYDPKSEVSELNARQELKVSPETFYIIRRSVEFWQASNGAFDITVAPLMDIWGFTDKRYSLPKDGQIKAALSLVGSDKIILNNEDNVIKFRLPGMKIDLGGIAKGYALDCAREQLKKHNIKNCLINAGGQVYCLGDKFGRPWKVAIRSPRGNDYIGNLELKDTSVSTSGDYQQYFVIGNKRFSHIFDPRTGYPANTGIISVSVVSPDGLTADALSTSIFVLGRKKGEELLKKFPGTTADISED